GRAVPPSIGRFSEDKGVRIRRALELIMARTSGARLWRVRRSGATRMFGFSKLPGALCAQWTTLARIDFSGATRSGESGLVAPEAPFGRFERQGLQTRGVGITAAS